MVRLKFWIIGLLLWFFLIFNLEIIGGKFNLTSYIPIYAAVCVILIIGIPQLQSISLLKQLLISLVPFLIYKFINPINWDYNKFPLALTEAAMIATSIILGSQIGKILIKYHQWMSDLTASQFDKISQSFEQGQAQIYREIQRARRYQRPASLLAVSVDEDSLEDSIDEFARQAQRDVLLRFANGRLAKILVNNLHETDYVTQRDNHFVMVLPETDLTGSQAVAKRLEKVAKEQLGLNILIGKSSFPEGAVTFETMLENAENEMRLQSFESKVEKHASQPLKIAKSTQQSVEKNR